MKFIWNNFGQFNASLIKKKKNLTDSTHLYSSIQISTMYYIYTIYKYIKRFFYIFTNEIDINRLQKYIKLHAYNPFRTDLMDSSMLNKSINKTILITFFSQTLILTFQPKSCSVLCCHFL